MTNIKEEVKNAVQRAEGGIEYIELTDILDADREQIGDAVEELVAMGELGYTSDWKVVA